MDDGDGWAGKGERLHGERRPSWGALRVQNYTGSEERRKGSSLQPEAGEVAF